MEHPRNAEPVAESRRSHYRAIPEELLEVAMGAAHQPLVHVTVLDASVRGLGVRVERLDDVAWQVDEEVRILIRHVASARSVTVSGRVVRRSKEDPAVFGLELLDLAEVFEAADSRLWKLFNRRRHFRVEPLPERPVELTIEGWMNPVRAIDISAGGLAFRTGRSAIPEVDDELALKVFLPGAVRPLALTATVRNVTGGARAARVGVEFVREGNEKFSVTQDAIIEYVMERQRERLEK